VSEKKDDRDYEVVQLAGNRAGAEKFERNLHKKGFNDVDIGYIMNRMAQEMQEAADAYKAVVNLNLTTNSTEKARRKFVKAIKALRWELADVINFGSIGVYQLDILIEVFKKPGKKF